MPHDVRRLLRIALALWRSRGADDDWLVDVDRGTGAVTVPAAQVGETIDGLLAHVRALEAAARRQQAALRRLRARYRDAGRVRDAEVVQHCLDAVRRAARADAP